VILVPATRRLGYLKRFPVDGLKIDRCFIHDVANDADNRAITAAIISMAQQLSLRVIGEGVETWEQLNYLRLRMSRGTRLFCQ
jgi:sensor c-di-GMP phosphodiesterase-like protein